MRLGGWDEARRVGREGEEGGEGRGGGRGGREVTMSVPFSHELWCLLLRE